MTREITATELIDRYDAFLLDAYGVLVTAGGPVPGAAGFISALRRADRRFVVVTNDASRLPETCALSYAERGLEVAAEDIVTSGALIARYFDEHNLSGAPSMVLGPHDSCEYVRRAGGELVERAEDADVIVIADESGFDFMSMVDAVTTAAIRRHSSGQTLRLVVPNPDCIYPKGDGEFGIASGGVAAMIEAALSAVFGDEAPRFDRLGKPHAPIYRAGLERLQCEKDRAVMVGDQLDTDIRGALQLGLDAALLLGGVGAPRGDHIAPTWLLNTLTD